MGSAQGGDRQRLLAPTPFGVALACLLLAAMLAQGLLVERQAVRDDPLAWAPNLFGAVATLGLACPALAGCFAWWRAPAGANQIAEYSPTQRALFAVGKGLTTLGFAGVVLAKLVSSTR